MQSEGLFCSATACHRKTTRYFLACRCTEDWQAHLRHCRDGEMRSQLRGGRLMRAIVTSLIIALSGRDPSFFATNELPSCRSLKRKYAQRLPSDRTVAGCDENRTS